MCNCSNNTFEIPSTFKYAYVFVITSFSIITAIVLIISKFRNKFNCKRYNLLL